MGLDMAENIVNGTSGARNPSWTARPLKRARQALLGMLLWVLGSTSHGAARPNFIFILADDLGWRDLGCYGSTFYETPAIDGLAASGMRFTSAYAACPVCSP